MIKLAQPDLRDIARASICEWLETNGLGGFASSTVTGLNTRRYHGLLVAATRPPAGRLVLLSKLEEALFIGERRFDLASNQYQGAVHPEGYRFLTEFRLDPFPVFVFEVDGVRVEKSVFMVRGRNTTVMQYRLLQAPPDTLVRLELRPLIAFRDYHGTTHENRALDPRYEESAGLLKLSPYPGLPALFLAHNAQSVAGEGYWYRNFVYEVERERGLDFLEDLFNPLVMHFALNNKPSADVIASLEPLEISSAGMLRRLELERREGIVAAAPAKDEFVRSLTLAADQFLVKRGEDFTIIAGYPWFTDWGRDTMIALPGLTLCSGNAAAARSILLSFSKYVDQGMLPNRFPDHGESPEYNTVDATLWYFEAIRAYVAATSDFDLVKKHLYPVLTGIIDWHVRGTRYNIRMMENGLLNAGEAGVQLTWMDAKIGDWVVTPRMGKPVEIQALWFNALKIMEDFAARLRDGVNLDRYRTISALLGSTFNRLFWNESQGCLFDVVNGTADGSIRPNQIFAVSLPHSMLAPDRARGILEVVERELLTPYGLRTLSPKDPNYRGHYGGDQRSRDSAYHQGTVWPWLMGPFLTAYMRVHGKTEAARQRMRQLLQPLQAHLLGSGLGQVSEVFDAEPPFQPGGCFAQAWSVGELLRVVCALENR